MSQAEFARQFGCDTLTAGYWIHGQVLPSLINAYRLDAFTRGAVPAVAWLGTELGKAEYAKAAGSKGNQKGSGIRGHGKGKALPRTRSDEVLSDVPAAAPETNCLPSSTSADTLEHPHE